jgi:hypothetical protein
MVVRARGGYKEGMEYYKLLARPKAAQHRHVYKHELMCCAGIRRPACASHTIRTRTIGIRIRTRITRTRTIGTTPPEELPSLCLNVRGDCSGT